MVLCSFGRRTAFGTTYCNSIVRPRITPLALLGCEPGCLDSGLALVHPDLGRPPQLVPEEDLASANALNGLSQEVGSLIGPALGALFVTLTSPAPAFALDGATFVFSAGCLLAMGIW